MLVRPACTHKPPLLFPPSLFLPQVFHDGDWGTVCNAQFTNADAGVICRLLGGGYTDGHFVWEGIYPGTGPVFLNYIGVRVC